MKTKIKNLIMQIKHIFSNANFKIRYNNLLKKYNELAEENANLTKKLSKEYINCQLLDAQKQAKKYKTQRDQVREDYIELQKSIKNREN